MRTEIVFKAAGAGPGRHDQIATEGDICIMIAIAHQLRLTSDAPLPAAQVTLQPATCRGRTRAARGLAREAAVRVDELAGRPRAVVREQERDELRDVLGRPEATRRLALASISRTSSLIQPVSTGPG